MNTDAVEVKIIDVLRPDVDYLKDVLKALLLDKTVKILRSKPVSTACNPDEYIWEKNIYRLF